MPDMGFLNLSDMTGVARRIAAAVEIPVMIDADTGYGNAMDVVTASRPLSAVFAHLSTDPLSHNLVRVELDKSG
jgi:2-methylisocitrate lyase-like PEP mutase family enzyme